MEQSEVEQMAEAIYAHVMKSLRDLDWRVREETCARLLYNDEFCWHCGREKVPRGAICYCTARD